MLSPPEKLMECLSDLEKFLHDEDSQLPVLINELFASDSAKLETLGRAKFSCIQILEYLKKLPQVSVPLLSKALEQSAPTARSSLNHMVKLGILEEISGKKRDKIYIYRKYLKLLEQGAEPLP